MPSSPGICQKSNFDISSCCKKQQRKLKYTKIFWSESLTLPPTEEFSTNTNGKMGEGSKSDFFFFFHFDSTEMPFEKYSDREFFAHFGVCKLTVLCLFQFLSRLPLGYKIDVEKVLWILYFLKVSCNWYFTEK